MTLPPRTLGPQAGVTLFEALISLTVLALMAGVVIAGRGGPSPALTLNSKVAEVKAHAAGIRRDAILQDADQIWQDADLTCAEETFEVVYFADGTARGTDICMAVDTVQVRLKVDPLTGLLLEPDK